MRAPAELIEALLLARRQAEQACRQLKLKAPIVYKPVKWLPKVWYK
jgi:hypothetical protein